MARTPQRGYHIYTPYRKDYCEWCCDNEFLHVHHANGDHDDNDPGNLQTLCYDCHIIAHKILHGGTYKIPAREFIVLNFVTEYQQQYADTPDCQEIADEFGYKRGTARQYVRSLEVRGAIKIKEAQDNCDNMEIYIDKNAFAIFPEDEID